MSVFLRGACPSELPPRMRGLQKKSYRVTLRKNLRKYHQKPCKDSSVEKLGESIKQPIRGPHKGESQLLGT